MHGYSSPDEIIGRHFSVTQVKADLDNAQENVARLLSGEAIPSGEFSRRCKDGSIGYHTFSASPIINSAGEIVGLEGFLIDISEQRKADEERQFEYDRLVSIMDSIPYGVYIVDQRFNIQYINPVMAKEFGPINGRKCYAYFHERTEVCPWCKNADVVAGKSVQWEWYSLVTHRHYLLFDAPIKNADGSIVKFEISQDITEFKQTEAKLLESEKFVKSILDSVDEGFIVIDRDYRIISANRAFTEKTGMFRGDIVGKHCFEISHHCLTSCYEEGDLCAVKHVFDTGESQSVIHTHHDVTGAPVYVDTKAYPLTKDESGKVMTVIEILVDITEKKKIDKDIQENEEKFRNLFNNADIAMFRSRLDGSEVLDVNQKFLDLVGVTREETLGKPSQILWGDQKEREKMVQRLVTEGRVSQLEFQMLNVKTGVRDCITSLVLYREQGILEGSILDITEKKYVEKALKESEERFRSAFEHAAIGFSIYSTEGHFIRVNQALCDMMGYSEEELKFKTFQDITHPDDLGSNMDKINQLLSGKLPVVHFQKRYIHKLGHEVWASMSVSVVRDDKGAPIYLVSLITDLTEKRKLADQLRHAQKMEAVGTLAGGIAHDFNNILNVIMGYGSMVLDGLEGNSSSKGRMTEVLSAAEKAVNLTKRLLAFSRKQVIDVKPVNINELILGLQKMLFRIIRESIDFNLALADRPLIVLADAGQIEQVFMNLITNARDAMPEGGRLKVGTELQELDDEYVAVNGYGKPGKYALITVADTGHGMDKETQKNIFEPFFTTKGIGEGTGLGLAISYGIIKQHSGYIKVYSEQGQGTVFKIYLPLIEGTEAQDRETEISCTVQGGNETVLVAEDDASLRKLYRIVLESSGYSVITAEDGEVAITKFMENRDKIQLAVLDMIMPKKSGKEVSEVIRKVSPRIKVLFVSGYTMDKIKTEELTESGFDFIHKPIRPQDLLKKVREALNR